MSFKQYFKLHPYFLSYLFGIKDFSCHLSFC